MNKKVFLISENNVRAYTNMDDNIQSKFLKPAILESQLELEGILGEKLLAKIQDEISGNTISGIYKDILDDAQYYLAYNTMSKVIVMATVKIANVGAITTNDDNMYSIGIKDAYGLEEYYKRKVDSWTLRLQNFLLKHRVEIPELTDNKVNEIKSNLFSASSTGVFLGGARGKGIYDRRHIGYDKKD